MTPAKKLYIKTYGCQMNVYDSARMADVLAPLGYAPTQSPREADMVILNTCHIREKAAEKVFSELGRLKPLKDAARRRGGRMILAVAGCVAQAEGAEILARAPHVDIVLGPQTYHRLPELVATAMRRAGGVLDTDFPVESKFDHLPGASAPQGISSFLTIQEGCDKFCTFCVVPYTRGAEFSRPASEVLEEARTLGRRRRARDHAPRPERQRLSWGGTRRRMGPGPAHSRAWRAPRPRAHPLHRLASPRRRRRAHRGAPRRGNADAVPAFAGTVGLGPHPCRDEPAAHRGRLSRHPGASAARAARDRLLVRFHRGLSRRERARFRGDAGRWRARSEFAQSFSFKYSPRPGTPAATEPDQVPDSVKSERLRRLQELLESQQRAFNRSQVGRTLDVLLERPGRHPGQLVGRSPYLQPVHVPAPAALVGALVPVRIVGAEPNSLAGERLDREEPVLA